MTQLYTQAEAHQCYPEVIEADEAVVLPVLKATPWWARIIRVSVRWLNEINDAFADAVAGQLYNLVYCAWCGVSTDWERDYCAGCDKPLRLRAR